MAFEASTVRILYDDQVRDCPSIVSQYGATVSIDNIRDQIQATQCSLITSSNLTYLQLDFGAGNTATANGFALLNHSVGNGVLEYCNVKVGTLDNGSTFDITCASWTPDADEELKDVLMAFPQAYTKRYWRISFYETPGGVEIGEMLLGTIAEFNSGLSRPWTVERHPNVHVRQSVPKTRSRKSQGVDYLVWSIPGPSLVQADWETLAAIFAAQQGPLWPVVFAVGEADSDSMGTGEGWIDPDYVFLGSPYLSDSWKHPTRHGTTIILQDLME